MVNSIDPVNPAKPTNPEHPINPTVPGKVTSTVNDVTLGAIRGELTFDDKVVQKIIGIALEEIDGLLTVDGGFFSNIAEKLVNTDNVASGIHAEVGKEQVAVDMDVVVEYGKDIREIYQKMKGLISTEVEKMTHLEVIEVNVNVSDIKTRAEFEKSRETVQDKVTNAAVSTSDYMAKQTVKPPMSPDKRGYSPEDPMEPRVK